MTGRVPARRAVPSPCTGLCAMDAARRWCDGCLRSLDEIAGWAAMSEDEKRRVWTRLSARRAARESTLRGADAGRRGDANDADPA